MPGKKSADDRPPLTEEAVAYWLRAHPDFLFKHPDLLEVLIPPEQDLGDAVSDFQHFAIKRLQGQMKDVRTRYKDLVVSAQDNVSVQQQVHKAILNLMRARGLEQLLEVLTVDLVHLFAVDVVRLGMESLATELYGESFYPEQQYSGLVFVEPGVIATLFDGVSSVRLCSHADELPVDAFEQVFAECTQLVKSCALLRLHLKEPEGYALLAFGVRNAGQFDPAQGIDLLEFLARIIEERLATCLRETGLDGPL